SLHNLNIVVVSRRSNRRTGALENQASFRQGPVLRPVEFVAAICPLPFLLSFAGGGQNRRDFSILGIDDQRRSSGFDDLRPAVPPEIVVCAAHVGFGRSVPTIFVVSLDNVFFVCRRFLLREEFLVGKIGRTLHRRDRRKAPGTLQVRLTVGRT